MSDSYLKCSCRLCDGRIEFPTQAVGMKVTCPHCGGTTDLYAPASAAPPVTAAAPPVRSASSLVPGVPTAGASRLQMAAPPPQPVPVEEIESAPKEVLPTHKPNWIGWSLAGVTIILFLVAGMMYLNNKRQGKSSILERTPSVAVNSPKNEESKPSDTPADDGAKQGTAAAALPPKSIEDLKVSPVTLRKAPNSTLVYAIGTVRNNSDQQRFGVSLEFDLLDGAGKKIGTAKDYAKVIEPRKEWRFRALVVAPKTAAVKLAKIKEDE